MHRLLTCILLVTLLAGCSSIPSKDTATPATSSSATSTPAPTVVDPAAPSAIIELHPSSSQPTGTRESITADLSSDPVVAFTATQNVSWDFGDGRKATGTTVTHRFMDKGTFTVTVMGALAATLTVPITRHELVPHAVLAIADTGFNPYHADFQRPWLTAHPCTYLASIPCTLPALNLTLDATSLEDAIAADLDTWRSVQDKTAYWIPRTNIVAAICHFPYTGPASGTVLATEPLCILGENHHHGTAVASAATRAAPDVFLALIEGAIWPTTATQYGVAFDATSISFSSTTAGLPVPSPTTAAYTFGELNFQAAGNNADATPIDGQRSTPTAYLVGGAVLGLNNGATPTGVAAQSGRSPDLVAPYTQTVAAHDSLDGTITASGTSFAAPYAAASAANAIHLIRQASGYTGTTRNDVVDATLDVTLAQVRDAINRSATFTFPDEELQCCLAVPTPLVPGLEHVDAGWGYFGPRQGTLAAQHLLGDPLPDRSAAVTAYMQARQEGRDVASEASHTVRCTVPTLHCN